MEPLEVEDGIATTDGLYRPVVDNVRLPAVV